MKTLLNLIPSIYLHGGFFILLLYSIYVYNIYIATQEKPVLPQSTNQTIVDLSNMENI